MRRSFLAAAVVALALTGCSSGGVGRFGLSSPAPSDRYLATASATDAYEIQAAELALAQAERPDVRAYAQRLIEEHNRTIRGLSDAAYEAGTTPPAPAPTAPQQRMLGELQGAPAGAFDEAYLRQQVDVHEAASKLHRAYALTGATEPLRRTAALAHARVIQHLEDVRRLRRLGEV
jgi:putative membrane protein